MLRSSPVASITGMLLADVKGIATGELLTTFTLTPCFNYEIKHSPNILGKISKYRTVETNGYFYGIKPNSTLAFIHTFYYYN